MTRRSQEDGSISRDLQKELEALRILRPYLARCLTLNHDINNPLAGILGYAEFLLDESSNLSVNQKQDLERIQNCAKRIKEIVDGLCEVKIALAEKLDLKTLTDRYADQSPDLQIK
ncbi:MAG: hypothetical protein JSU65_00045 [Candidatus Zixiibacteriota bacterium]|nr:MAG: hypothetical protein JSU65_00045 [candidate division Zixibacteria bacterium]